MKKKTASNGLVSAEDFVRVWQTAATFKDVVRAFPGRKRKNLSMKASTLRRAGVGLKHFAPEGGPAEKFFSEKPDIAKIAALAKSLAPKA